jgi:hypothetical protein
MGERTSPWIRSRRAMAATLLIACPPAAALDYQVHGFAAQGYIVSDGNNFFGESTHGSHDYYELGLNGALQVTPDLLVSAQAYAREAGATDDDRVRLDFGLADCRLLHRTSASAGVRLGRVKNPIGFFNNTRDTVFTRPGIVMPTSVYQDNAGQRSILFSSDGLQLYGDLGWGGHELQLTGTAALNRDLTENEERLIVSLGPTPFNLRFREFWNVRVLDEVDGGRWRFAASHAQGTLILAAEDASGIAGDFFLNIEVLSVAFNAAAWSLTAEYALIGNDNVVTINGTPALVQEIKAEGAYLQGDYRLTPSWSLMARYDAFFLDRNDRDGRGFAAVNPGADRHSRFAHDLTAGVTWSPDAHWGVWAEVHQIDGTASVQGQDNIGNARDNPWSMLLLMAGYRF